MSWLASSISSLISRKQTEKAVKNIQMGNLYKRNVKEYLPSEIEGFFDPTEPLGSTIISGGLPENRARAVVAACICSYNKDVPVVVLHETNSCLENKMRAAFYGSNNIEIVNSNCPIYDPFVGLSNMEIDKIILNSAPKGYEIKSIGRQYLDGISEFIRSKRVTPFCDMYIRCPHANLYDKLDEANLNGYLSDTATQNIKNMLMQGQTERASVENFFAQFENQGKKVLATKANIQKAVNVRKSVMNKSVLMLDILSSTNDILINIIVNEIIDILAQGKQMLLVIDSISICSNALLEKLIKSNTSRCFSVLSSDDVYSMLTCNESLFTTLVGTSNKCIIYYHKTGLSCGKWADVFGYYDKEEISQNMGSTLSYQSGYSYGTNSSITVNPKREHIIKPEDISRMAVNEVYVLCGQTRELAHCLIV